MPSRFKISNLEAGQLDNTCLTILSKISRTLIQRGIVLKLQDKDILKKVDFHARSSDNKELTILHAQLKVALKAYVSSAGFKEKLPMIMYKHRQQELRNKIDNP